MAVRTAFDAVAGSVLTAANLDKYPGGWIGYVEVTANQTGISSVTDLTSLSVTVTAGTSRRLKTEGYAVLAQNTSTAAVSFTIRSGASAQLALWQAVVTGNTVTTGNPKRVDTPSSGANTYKLSLAANAGTVDLNASSTSPAFILVEDIGPSA